MLYRILPLVFSRAFFQKLFIFSLFGILIYILRGFLPIFLIAFIFAYLFLETSNYILEKIQTHGKKLAPKNQKIVEKYVTHTTVVTFLYIVFIILMVFLLTTILPRIAYEIENLISNIPDFYWKLEVLLKDFEDSSGIYIGAQDIMQNLISNYNFRDIGMHVIDYIRNIGGIMIRFFIGIILSYIFLIDRKSITHFLEKMKKGSFAFIYNDTAYLITKIGNSFGKVFKAQAIIATVNAILSTLGLLILGHIFHNNGFPYIFVLSVIVFIFGFIPVFGTFLSGLPIIIIGYGFGGINIVIGAILLISIIHAIEAYILNPKIMSSYIHFPVFVTFIVLLISEHIFGFIGMIIGLPLFAIFLSLFRDLDSYIRKVQKHYNEQLPECHP